MTASRAAQERIDHDVLRRWVVDVLTAVGVGAHDSQVLAASLVSADLRGIATHGVTRLPI
jgi:LDH2 family malate/lactate/ureidoglycolate dehydrogenase